MRNDDKKNRGLTLTELLVVMSIMLVLMAVALPVAKKLAQSLENSTGPNGIISAAMANARAIAVREQKYAGVRFQQDSSGRQYLVLIIHDPNATGLAYGFRAVPGKKPMALPEETGAIAGNSYVNTDLDSTAKMTNANTFSVVFSPAGKFVNYDVLAFNQNARTDDSSTDRVFNTQTNVSKGIGMFVQDAAIERSVSSFILYHKNELAKVAVSKRWDEFFKLEKGTTGFVNPHTGELVKKN